MDVTFPNNFVWGVSSSAYQIEGAAITDGKGPSIWDTFSHTANKIKHSHTGDVACDHYHLYKHDVALMKELGLTAYRFSTSWPRFFPEGKGKANPKGRDFYNRLVDELLASGLEPWLCFYHWDLPQTLQDKGGWTNRDMSEYYCDYAAYVSEQLGDRVRHFVLFNEPNVAALLGHLLGIHAPGLTDMNAYAAALHHLNLATGLGAARLRSINSSWQLGTVLNLAPIQTHTDKDEDEEARLLFDAIWNRSVLDPILKGSYPKLLSGILEDVVQAGDLGKIQQPLDFLGVNHYTRILIKHDPKSLVGLRLSKPPKGAKLTAMDWEIYPQGLYELLLELKNDYGNPKVFITENGAAFEDELTTKGVHDPARIGFFEGYLEAVQRARNDGANVAGYFAWSLLDNFEWAEGYEKRFGIVYVDYTTQKRIPKDSYHWYKELIRNGGYNFGGRRQEKEL
ncbi:MAG: GH1 family beta-glucosidase [Trueperaceae bacterium]